MFSTFNTFSSSQYKIVKNILKLADVLLPNTFIDNESFESPSIDGIKGYSDLTEVEKEEFKWVAGGNGGAGPRISDGGSDFGFPSYINGEQALAMQSTSFIEQTLHLNIGTYVFSTYFISRNGEQNNPIEVSINGEIITTIDQVEDDWKLFTHTFDIVEAGNKTLRLEGLAEGDLTTGIDLVAVSKRDFQYFLANKPPYVYYRAKDYEQETGNIPA
jgi:hypothetical protein